MAASSRLNPRRPTWSRGTRIAVDVFVRDRVSNTPAGGERGGESRRCDLRNEPGDAGLWGSHHAGSTGLTTSTDGPPPPAGFALGDPATYYDLTTTAEFTPPVTVCIDYTGVSFQDEAQLRLLHFEEGAWVDQTSSLDTGANIICGIVSSLSPFVVAGAQGVALTALGAANVWIGLKNSDDVGTRFDVRAEVLKNGGTWWVRARSTTCPEGAVASTTPFSVPSPGAD